MAAYAFARLRWPGRDLVFALFLTALMVPADLHRAAQLPHSSRQLGLLNTLPGIVLPFFFMTPFAVFFLRQFFLGITAGDRGGGHDRRRRALPDLLQDHPADESRPPIITLGDPARSSRAWNEYFWPLLVGQTEGSRVLTVALGVFRSQTPQGRRTGPA